MSKNPWCVISLVICLSTMAVVAGCGSATSAPISGYNPLGEISVSITPPAMSVGTTTTQTFAAVVNNSGQQTVQWQVNGLPGGAPIIGTIDSSGNYTAPQFVPNPPTVTITAVANADSSKSGNATATITGTLFPAQVFMSPAGSAYVQAGTQLKLSGGVVGPADTSVDWQVNGVADGNSALGTITRGANNTAVYTAPAKVPNPPTVTIKALSHAEPSKFTFNKVTLSEQPPTIATVTVTPVVAVAQAQTDFTFTADVINASDDSVSWQVNAVTGGSQVDGTIASEGSGTGVYTGPTVVPPLGSAVTVTAVSNAQPSRVSSANLNISPPAASGIGVAVSGDTSITTGSGELVKASVFATGTGVVTDPSVTWQVNGVTRGNSTYGTLQVVQGTGGDQVNYFSPANVPLQNTVVIGAVSSQNPHIVGTLAVQITPVKKTLKVATPSGQTAFNLGINQTQVLNATVSGEQDQTAIWYVCVSLNDCTQDGNSALGTITPTTPTDSVVYTAPASVPSPSTLIIKAVSHADPSVSGTATVTVGLQQIVTVQVTPSGAQKVQAGLSIDGFLATVNGSTDQTVSWQVCTTMVPPVCYPNGNQTYGTMFPDQNFPNEEDYLAPVNIPNPATVTVSAIPEANPLVVSNMVPITIVPDQQNITVTVDLDLPVILPTQSDTATASVTGTSNQTVNWSLSLPASEGGGVCTNQPLVCGTISPIQTENVPATYTPPNPPPNDPWYVNINATSVVPPFPSGTAQVEITKDATSSISIMPDPPPQIPAGSGQFISFTVKLKNIAPGQNIFWEMQCMSQVPQGVNHCGDPFGHSGVGTGCITGEDGQVSCNDSGVLQEAETNYVQYTPPPQIGNVFNANSCTQNPGTDGILPLGASVNGNCPGGTCSAQVCITVTPAGAK
jgi:hypothetical protein